MRCADRVDPLLTLGALDCSLTVRQTELVSVEGAGLAPVNDTNLLVRAFAVQFVLLVVFHVSVTRRYVGRGNLRERVLDLTSRF